MREYLVQVAGKKYLARRFIELSLSLVNPRTFKFRAGQFVFFNVNGAFKAYSVTSPPADKKKLRFLIKLEPRGVAAAFVRRLQIGSRFAISGPEGGFTVKQRTADLCLVAAGLGLAPFLSIIPDLLAKGFPGQITLVYGYRAAGDLFCQKELSRLSGRHPRLKTFFIPGRRNKLAAYLGENYAKYQNCAVYICGRKAAVAEIQRAFVKKKHALRRIFTESFN